MAYHRQNFVLFFEENEDQRKINQNLVRLYMNRFIIDESWQHEIIGCHELSKVSKSLYEDRFENKQEWLACNTSEALRKWKHDEKLFIKGLQQSKKFETQNVDIHWIIGSPTLWLMDIENSLSEYINHTQDFDITGENYENELNEKTREFFENVMLQYPALRMEHSIVITLLQGCDKKLCTGKELRLEYFESEKSDTSSRNQTHKDTKSDLLARITRFRKSLAQKKRKDSNKIKTESVGDDLESIYSIVHSWNTFDFASLDAKSLYLFRMLKDDEISRMEELLHVNSEEGMPIDQNAKIRKNSFKKMIQNRLSNILPGQSIKEIAVEETFEEQKFVISACERITFFLSFSDSD